MLLAGCGDHKRQEKHTNKDPLLQFRFDFLLGICETDHQSILNVCVLYPFGNRLRHCWLAAPPNLQYPPFVLKSMHAMPVESNITFHNRWFVLICVRRLEISEGNQHSYCRDFNRGQSAVMCTATQCLIIEKGSMETDAQMVANDRMIICYHTCCTLT